MSTGYTKQSTYANGNVISATLFNNDFGKLEDAFSYSTDPSETGHTHDGSSGQGGAIAKIGDPDFNNKIQIDGTNNLIKFFVEVGGNTSTEILNVSENGLIPVASNVSLGTVANPFSTANITTVTATSLTVDTDTLHVDSSNNRVGIGTNSPDFPLHLKNTEPKLVMQDTDGTNQYGMVSHSAGETSIVSRNDTSMGTIVFSRYNGTTTTDSMQINNFGNVGIGISPSARLHVSHTTNSPTGILTNNNSNAVTASSNITARSTNGEVALIATPNTYTTVSSWADSGVLSADSDLSGGLILHAGADDIKFQSGSTHTELMRITSAGKVGIGTDDPSAPLDIASSYPSIRLTSIRNDNDWTNNALLGKIEFYSSDTSSIASTRAQILALAEDVNGTTAGLQFSVGDTPIPRMWIKAGGSVGIGASSPNHKLHVHGGDIMVSSESNLNSDGKPALLFSEQSHVNTGSDDSSAGIVYDGLDQTGDAKYLGLGVWDNSQDDQDTLAEQKATTTLNITRDNKVGIGTITPTETLDIEDTDLDNSVTLKVKNLAEATDDTTLPSSELKVEADGVTGTITVEGVGSSDSSLGKVSINGTVGKPLTFGTGVNEHARFMGGHFLINHEAIGTVNTEQGIALTSSGRGYFTTATTADDAVLKLARFDVDTAHEYISFDYQDTTNNALGSLGAIKVYAADGLVLQTQNEARLASAASTVSLSSNSAELILSTDFRPHVGDDGAINLGSGANRFNQIYLAGSVNLSSDSTSADTQFIMFKNDDDRIAYIRADYSAAEAGNGTGITIATNPSQGTSVERLKVSEDGDITFFADDGTTSGLVWDTSEQNLSVSGKFIADELSTESGTLTFTVDSDGNAPALSAIVLQHGTNSPLAKFFAVNNTVQFFDTSGNVKLNWTSGTTEEGLAIGTGNAPTEMLDVVGNIAVSGTVDGVDIAALGANAIVDGDFTSDGFMKRTGAGTYTVDTNTYLTSFTEVNDLSTAVTWADVPDANITESSVTQHQAALSITESQISDLGTYLTASDITGKADLSGADFTGNVTTTGTLATGGYTLASTDGTNGQALVTDGSGNVSFGDVTVDVSGKADLSGATFTGDVRLNDDVSLRFGDSSSNAAGDLRIYHDAGSTSTYITESGAGALRIGGENLYLNNEAGDEIYILCVANGGVKLHYDDDEVASTVDGGFHVSGDLTATNGIHIGNAGGYTLSTTDGQNGQALVTDGNGNVSFTDVNVNLSGKANLSGASFTGDIDVGLRAPTSSELLVNTRTVEELANWVLYITSNSYPSVNVTYRASLDVNGDGDYSSSDAYTVLLFVNDEDNGYTSAQQDTYTDIITGTDPDNSTFVADLLNGDYDVPSYALKVDTTNKRVGVLTQTPAEALDVVGNIKASGNVEASTCKITSSASSEMLEVHNTGTNQAVKIQSLASNTTNTNILEFKIKGNDTSANAVDYASITSDVISNLTADPKANINLIASEVNLKASNIYMDSVPSIKGKDTSTLSSVSAVGVTTYNTYEDDDKGRWTTSSQDASWYKAPLNTSTRGSTKDFPSLATVVVTVNTIYIHDATKEDNPVWIEIPISALKDSDISCEFAEDEPTMRNGKLLVTIVPTAGETGVIHAALIDFAEDQILTYRGNDIEIVNSGNLTASSYTLNQNLVGVGSGFNSHDIVTSTLGGFPTLSNLKVSPKTGLPKAIVVLGGNGSTGIGAAISYVNEIEYGINWYYQSSDQSQITTLKPNSRGSFTFGLNYDDNSTHFTGLINGQSSTFDSSNLKSLTVYDTHIVAPTGSPFTAGGVQNSNAAGDSTIVHDCSGNVEVLSYTDNTIGMHKEITGDSVSSPMMAAKITDSGISGWVDRYNIRTVFADTVSQGTGTVTEAGSVPLLSTPRHTVRMTTHPSFTIPAANGSVNPIERAAVATGADLLGYTATDSSGTDPVITSSTGSANALNFDNDDGFTVSLWVKPTTATSTKALCKIGLDNGNQLQITMSADRVVEVYHKTSGTTFSSAIIESLDSLSLGEWSCVAVTRDKQSNIIKIYVNGNLSGFEYYDEHIGTSSSSCQIILYPEFIYSLFKLSNSYLGNDIINESIFKDEKQLFKAAAKCELDGTSPYRVAYNQQTGSKHIANNNEYAEYRGLVRLNTDTSSGLASTTKGLSSVSNITIGE